MKDDDELSQAVKDGIKAGESMINDLYNLIEEWKERGISEENIARVLVFIHPDVILSTAPSKQNAYNLLNISINKIAEVLNEDESSDNGETVH
tara:strand:+ start:3969 stop:4247 length:279 start_codon:yes stop_codon:yes gene_type:complete